MLSSHPAAVALKGSPGRIQRNACVIKIISDRTQSLKLKFHDVYSIVGMLLFRGNGVYSVSTGLLLLTFLLPLTTDSFRRAANMSNLAQEDVLKWELG